MSGSLEGDFSSPFSHAPRSLSSSSSLSTSSSTTAAAAGAAGGASVPSTPRAHYLSSGSTSSQPPFSPFGLSSPLSPLSSASSSSTLPKIPAFECVSVLSSSCELRWQAPPPHDFPAEGYEIAYREAGNDGPWSTEHVSVVALQGSEQEVHYCVSGLRPATSYRLRVRACYGAGVYGDYSFPPLKVDTESSPPQPPQHLTITSRTRTSMAIAWEPGHNGGHPIMQYELQYTLRQTPWPGWTGIAVTKNKCVMRDLQTKSTYDVRVRARNFLGWSEPCTPCTVVLDGESDTPTPPPPKTTDLVETPDGLCMQFTFPAQRDDVTFVVLTRTSQQLDWTEHSPTITLTRTAHGLHGSCRIPALKPGVTNHVCVRARNACGMGPWGPVVTVAAHVVPPALAIDEVGHSWALMKWTGDEGMQFELDFQREGGAGWQTARSDLHVTSVRKRNLDPTTRYQFRVRLCHQGRWTSYSNTVAIKTTSLDSFLETARRECLMHACKLFLNPMELMQPLTIFVRRAEVLEDTYAQFIQASPLVWARQIVVNFVGEEGADYGALHREWLIALIDQLANPHRALFTPLPNGLMHASHLHRMQEGSDAYYRMAGMALARALVHNVRINARFSTVVYKALLGLPTSMADLKLVDPDFHSSLEWIRTHDPSDLDLYFAVDVEEFGVRRVVPLLPGGENVAVTNANKDEFIKLRCQAALSSLIERPLQILRESFGSMVPAGVCTNMSITDLQLALCGSSVLSVEDWRRHTQMTVAMAQHASVVANFWRIVEEMAPAQRTQLLSFVTSMAALPPGGFANLNPRFTLEAMLHGSEGALPVAHACFCVLELPVWYDYETLKAKLLLAISETSGFGFM